MAEPYKALTRKYRPRTFDDIVSQQHVSSTLKNAIEQDRISHAYLFCGPRGVGKTTMARVLARTINRVDDSVDVESLGSTLNIVEIDAASNNKVEDIHTLREQVRIPPQNGPYKVYIIDEVHMLSKQAFNALLKTLEEPPDHVIFIFATTEPHKVLPTIISRCQRFDFRRIGTPEIVQRLTEICTTEELSIDKESLHVIAKKADGSLRDALGIMDQAIAFCGTSITYDELHRALNVVSSERIFELVDAIEKQDAQSGLGLIHELMQEGYDIQEFLNALTEHLRNMILARDTGNLYLIEATDELKSRFQKDAARFSENDLMRMLHITSDAQFRIREAQQPRIYLETVILKLIHMEKTGDLQQLLEELRELKDREAQPKQETGAPGAGQPAAAGETEGATGRSGDEAASTAGATDDSPSGFSSGASKDESSSGSSGGESGASPGRKTTPGSGSGEPAGEEQKQQEGIDLFGTPSIKDTRNRMSSVDLDDPGLTERRSGGHTGEALSTGSTSNTPPDQVQDPGQPASPQQGSSAAADEQTGSISGNLALATHNEAPADTPAESRGGGTPDKAHRQELYLHDVQELWPRYLEALQNRVEQLLYFTMQRVRPIDLDQEQLVLECNDSFACELVEEQRKQFSAIFRELSGHHLRFKPVLAEKKDEDEALDPYTRFKELQKKSPKLRTIVELFGAELEY